MVPKLIVGLKTLKKEEWSSLKKFILMQSRIDSNKYRCFALLQKQQNALENFQASKWHKRFMPELSEKLFLNTFSKLNIILEEWIVYITLSNDKIQSGIILVRHWNRKGKYELANVKAKQVQHEIDKIKTFSPETDHYQYQLYYNQFFSDNPIKDKDPTLVLKLIQSYLKTKEYKQALYKIQIEHWNNIRPLPIELYEELEKRLEINISEPILYHLQNLVLSNNTASFDFCYEVLIKGAVNRTDDFFIFITMHLKYRSLVLWRLQKIKNPNRIVEIYEFALKFNLLMVEGKIPQQRFIIIIYTVGALKPLKWTNTFIDIWIEKVNTPDIESTRAFAKAINYFNHKDFLKAHSLLHKINTYITNDRAIIHEFYIKVYYETRDKNIDLLYGFIEKYQAFLRRKKMANENARKRKNFIKNILTLLKCKDLSIPYNIVIPTNGTKWFLEKKDEL